MAGRELKKILRCFRSFITNGKQNKYRCIMINNEEDGKTIHRCIDHHFFDWFATNYQPNWHWPTILQWYYRWNLFFFQHFTAINFLPVRNIKNTMYINHGNNVDDDKNVRKYIFFFAGKNPDFYHQSNGEKMGKKTFTNFVQRTKFFHSNNHWIV